MVRVDNERERERETVCVYVCVWGGLFVLIKPWLRCPRPCQIQLLWDQNFSRNNYDNKYHRLVRHLNWSSPTIDDNLRN